MTIRETHLREMANQAKDELKSLKWYQLQKRCKASIRLKVAKEMLNR